MFSRSTTMLAALLSLAVVMTMFGSTVGAQCVDDGAAQRGAAAVTAVNAVTAVTAAAGDPVRMPLIGEPAPPFEAITTAGVKKLADYRGRWLVLFSHPADFTPVCTTEMIGFARAADRFGALQADLLGLSIDSRFSHIAWLRNIEEKFGVEVPFPIIDDVSMQVSRAYGMVHAGASSTATVRATFLIDPEGTLRALLYYPMSNGRSVDEILRLLEALQTTDAAGLATPEGWQPGDDGIAPPPLTSAAARERMRQNPDATDWYYVTTSMSTETEAASSEETHRAFVSDTLEPYECGSITRLHTFGGIFLASQPSPEDLEQAKKGGVLTVINQRHAAEVTEFDERAIVESMGLRYENPAFNGPDELTPAILDTTLGLLRTAPRPLLLHCSSANRTGAVWFAYRALDGGLSLDDALAEARRVGLRSAAYEKIVRAYIDSRRDGAARGGAAADVKRDQLHIGLVAALDDERRTRAFYEAVLQRYGSVLPFARLAEAEGRHAEHVVQAMRNRGLTVPEETARADDIVVPATLEEVTRLAIRKEKENVALYDRLLATIDDPEVRDVLALLRHRSAERHLPALQRSMRSR